MSLDVRAQFPQLKRQVRGGRLVYLDSGATSLKPVSVVEAVREHMTMGAANVHRGAHALSDEATEKFEGVREKARKFVGADSRNEIIFTRGTTESLNLVARSLGGSILNEGDEILLTQMEHHSNIVPWQMIAKEKKASIQWVKVLDDGRLDETDFFAKLSPRVKILSLVHISNALGTVNPVPKFFKAARAVGAFTVLDAAQSAPVMALDVKAMGCDFLALSAHKMFGPTGVGLLYGREELLSKMPPYQGGGAMIAEVREDGVEFLPPPHRFEAGTPAVAEVLGFGAAIDFVLSLDYSKIAVHERELLTAAEEGVAKIEGVRRIGTAPERSHVLSFLLDKAHPSDVGSILDEQGVAVRAGHHCCQPLMRRFGIPGTVRASFSVYNSVDDVDAFLRALAKAKELLS
jgi:cysteine desulfurase/selenocysteine lyase